MSQLPATTRILIVDDTPSIHGDFRLFLEAPTNDSLATAEAKLFGGEASSGESDGTGAIFSINSAYQGQEALAMVVAAVKEGNLEIVQAILKRWGIASSACDYAPNAVDELRSAHRSGRPYNLVITDIQMPDVDGLGLVRHLRAMPELGNIPIIILTSMGQVVPADERKQWGINSCLTKPVRQSRLFNAVINSLSGEIVVPDPTADPEVLNTRHEIQGNRRRILVAEDNEMNQMVMSAFLRNMNFDFTVVGDGVKAVEYAASGTFDLVLMDWQMPGLSGIEATRAIRERENAGGGLSRDRGRLPVIA